MSFFVIVVLIQFIYEDSDSLIVYDDSITVCGQHEYAIKVFLQNAEITITPWSGIADSTGWLCLHAPLIICQQHTQFLGSGNGNWGGQSGHGDGYGPGAGTVGGISGGGGGGAGYGGPGGDGGDYYPGQGGGMYGNAYDTLIDMGSGGGAGQYISIIDGYGGNGGAKLSIQGSYTLIDSSDLIMDGNPGTAGTIGLEGGGGGSGGGIIIIADTLTLHHTLLSADGGDGAGSAYGGGGGGGGGRIKVFFTDILDTLICTGSVVAGDGGVAYQGIDGNPGEEGTIHFEQIVGLCEFETHSSTFTLLYGSVVHSSLTVQHTPYPTTMLIYDATGKLVSTHRLTGSITTIPIQKLPAGVYFISTDDQSHTCTKFVVVK